jgi:alpha-1,6-rhamnosyltransferase
MTAPIKVSVLIPTRNRPDYLREAVFSAAASGFEDSFEIIVIHDGEPVQPMDGVRSFATPCPMGESALMNIALQEAKGEYLTILEDDDQILPHKLALLAAALDREPDVDAVFSLPVYIYPDGRSETPERLRAWLRANPIVTWDTIVRRQGLRFHGTSTMYRRTAWEKAGPWDETLTTGEEWEYHLRLLKCGCVFRGIDSVTTTYRIHDGQKSARAKRRTMKRKAQLALINQRYAVEVDA